MKKALCVIALLVLVSASAQARELPGAELELRRSDAARDCMDEAAFSAALRARMAPASKPGTLVHLRVNIDTEPEGFSAHIVAMGRIRGERRIVAAGPDCRALEHSLLVSLLLMLDETPDRPKKAPSVAESERAPAREANAAGGGPLWAAIGGMLTLGIPTSASGGALGDLSFRARFWEAGVTGFWIFPHERGFSPGKIELQAAGAQLRACAVQSLNPSLSVGECAAGMVTRLHARGSGFDRNESETRVWWLAGAGGQLRWALAPRFRLGLSAFLLASIAERGFFVEGLGPAFETPPVASWFGAEASVPIW